MKPIFILILYSIKFATINAAGGQSASGSGRKRPSEQVAQSAGGISSSNDEGDAIDNKTLRTPPIFRIGLFEKTENPNKIKCRECDKNLLISAEGCTSNLTHHLNSKHMGSQYKKLYDKIKRHGGRGFAAAIYDEDMFTKNVRERTAKCATCKRDYKGWATELEKHLSAKHPEVYKKYLERVNVRKEERTQRISQQKLKLLSSSGSIGQKMAQNVHASLNEPQQHGQMISFQQNDPNIEHSLPHENATSFIGQIVPSAIHRDQQLTPHLPISVSQEMLQQLYVPLNQPQHQGQTLGSGSMLHLSQRAINQIQHQMSQPSLSQEALAQKMLPSMNQQTKSLTMSAQSSKNISILNNLATQIASQQTAGQESGSGFQQPSLQMEKGKEIMTEETRTQLRPTSGRRLMEDAIRADRRTNPLGNQSISQQYYPQNAFQAGQLGSGDTMLRPSTFAHGRAKESDEEGGSGLQGTYVKDGGNVAR